MTGERLLEVAIDGRITNSRSLDLALDIVDLAMLPGGDVGLFDEGSEAHALAMESGGTIWIAAREGGPRTPLAQWKVTVRRIGAE